MQFYASPEQIMRDRSEYARKGIARGRSVVTLSYSGGILFVAENLSSSLHKVSEMYDRIGFAAAGRYGEFENLRMAGVRLCDLRGYSYDRADVTGRFLANAYAQTIGSMFTESSKPLEVEICVAQVGSRPELDELYRLTYDGSVADEPGYIVMGGETEPIAAVLKEGYAPSLSLTDALQLAVKGLAQIGSENGTPRTIEARQLEVAILDRQRAGRAFRRLRGQSLTNLLAEVTEKASADADDGGASGDSASNDTASTDSAADKPAEKKAGGKKSSDAKPADKSKGDAKSAGDGADPEA